MEVEFESCYVPNAMDQLMEKSLDDIVTSNYVEINLNNAFTREHFASGTGFSMSVQYYSSYKIYFEQSMCSIPKKSVVEIYIYGVKFFVLDEILPQIDFKIKPFLRIIDELICTLFKKENENFDLLNETVEEYIENYKIKNDYESFIVLYEYYNSHQNYSEAFYYLKKLEKFGVFIYLFELAECYKTGKGCKNNESMALYYHNRAYELYKNLPAKQIRNFIDNRLNIMMRDDFIKAYMEKEADVDYELGVISEEERDSMKSNYKRCVRFRR